MQAVDGGSMEPVTSCVHFYGTVYDSKTLAVIQHVEKHDATVSCLCVCVCVCVVIGIVTGS